MRSNEMEVDSSPEKRSGERKGGTFKMFRQSFLTNIEARKSIFQQRNLRKYNSNSGSSSEEIREQPQGIFRTITSRKAKQKKVAVDAEKENNGTEESCATAILQHSYFQCSDQDGDNLSYSAGDSNNIPEDPTVQESFECVFPSQLEQGLPHDLLWEESSMVTASSTDSSNIIGDLVSPAAFQQSLVKTRSSRSLGQTLTSAITMQKKQFQTGTLVHIGTYGTYDPYREKSIEEERENGKSLVVQNSVPEVPIEVRTPAHVDCSNTLCACCQKGNRIPQIDADDWIQRPLLFRPSPGSGTRVKGVRFVHTKEYLWKDGDLHTWDQALNKHWGKTDYIGSTHDFCSECMLLPINNGNEPKGETLVVDFVSPVFEGTIQVRLRHTNGTTKDPYNDDIGYFNGLNRRYQVIVQGKPLRESSMQNLVTGFVLERPFGKLPPKWVTKGAVKLVNFFAPEFKAKLDGPKPSCISPLGSTPQMIRVNGDLDTEAQQEEPRVAKNTLLGVASTAATSLARARTRKKKFDKLYTDKGSQTPTLTLSNTYTFEFLQHLINFMTFKIELGSMLGSIALKDLLDGQPLQIMAMDDVTEEKLWSFDIWHEDLLKSARRHNNNEDAIVVLDKRHSSAKF